MARIGSIAELGEWATVATVVTGGDRLRSVDRRPIALLIGEEAHGLDDVVVSAADYRITIPTSGPTESLNAAVAAGIAVYVLSGGSGEVRDGV